MDDEINLIDILRVTYRYKKPIFTLFVVSILVVFLFGITSPSKYKATTTLLTIESVSSGSALGGMLGLESSESGKLKLVLESKTLSKAVIEDLDLLKLIFKKKWDDNTKTWKGNFKPSMEDAIKAISKRVSIKVAKTDLNIIDISVLWDNPDLAANIANKYVEKLSDFINYRSIGITFQTIDPAIPPERPESRQIILKMILAALASLFVGIIGAFVYDYFKKMPPIKL
jgi:uncharacterized protein involved in exopolysaccharide biosynthesis